MEFCSGEGGGRGRRWRLRQVVPVVLLWMMILSRNALGCISTNCNLVLTEAQGEITSPCYPQKYPNSHSCKWIMQAPTGFIIQLSFLDFELEEAPGCIYDRAVVNTGSAVVKFCGLTAHGLTLNSTGNEMELSFTSDFSVQKRGFSVSFRHVAVALRNQKVKISSGDGRVTKVASSVSIPALSQFTVCFEVERNSQKQDEWLFTYYDSRNKVGLSLGSSSNGMTMVIDTKACPINNVISPNDFTSSMKLFCFMWTSSNGRMAVYLNGKYFQTTCSSSRGRSVPAGGVFQLGDQQSFNGSIYNLRLWNYAMTADQLGKLTCDAVGNVIDWDNSYWSIPSSLAQTDATLSCSVSPPSNTPLTTSCDTPGLGCPAASSPATSSTDSTNTTHATNANTYAPQTTSSTPTTPPTTTNHPTTNPSTHAEATYPRPPAPLPRAPSHHRSMISLGYISTPLRKRPNGARRPASTRPPPSPRVEAHVTKPAFPPVKVRATARPTNTQASPTRLPRSEPVVTQVTAPQPAATKERTTEDSEVLPLLSLWQNKSKASPGVGPAPVASPSSSMSSSLSVLSNRKNKPAVPPWLLLSMSSIRSQTPAATNWTDTLEPLTEEYLSGPKVLGYDLADLVEDGSAFNLFEFEPSFSQEEHTTHHDSKTEQSLGKSPVTLSLMASNLTGDSGNSVMAVTAASMDQSHGRLTPGTPTSTQTNHRVPSDIYTGKHQLEESSYTQQETLASPSLSSPVFVQPSPSLPSPSLLLLPLIQQPKQALSESDSFIESAHSSESGTETRSIQPSVASFKSESLQRNSEASTVDEASLLSLPAFPKAQTDSEKVVVDDTQHPKHPTTPVENSSDSIAESFSGQLPYFDDRSGGQSDSHLQPHAFAEFDDFPTNDSPTVDAYRVLSGSVLPPETLNKQSPTQKLTHPPALFDPADVVPKIHAVEEHVLAMSTDDNLESALNSGSYPSEMQTASPHPITEPATSSTGALVVPPPLQVSGLNNPSTTTASRSPTGSSTDASNLGFISVLEEASYPGRDSHTANTAGFKFISKSNESTLTHGDSSAQPVEMKNTTITKNSTVGIKNGNISISQGNKPAPDLIVNNGTSAKLNLTLPKPTVSTHSGNQSSGTFVNQTQGQVEDNKLNVSPTPKASSPVASFKAVSPPANSGGIGSLKKATALPAQGIPYADLPTKAALPCQCNQRFHFTCLCGLSSGNKRLFYRISFEVDFSATLTQEDVEQAVALWLNETFQNWTHVIYVENISVQPGGTLTSYTCQALLDHSYITNESLGEAAISTHLSSRRGLMGPGLQIQTASFSVRLIENCPEENPLHYRWPESRPAVTRHLPCFPYKDQSASRTCLISPHNYSSYWSPADFSNCTDIDTIQVSSENAAEVAEQLRDITNNELSDEEVSKVVTKVKELVNVAKINTTLAITVIAIISNVMTSTEAPPAATSEKALKTVDELVQKIEFDGLSINITSPNLALGILAVNTTTFNGTTLRAFIPPNASEPQIDFEAEQMNPLAQVSLPASLLSGVSLSEAERLSLSRISFMFFNSTSLFQQEQDDRSLSSYVVASSVGNFSISNLKEPVTIELAHLPEKNSRNPVCVFWDFSMNNGAGGWNGEGCEASRESRTNRTVCLCDHLTHFGILMDISGVSAHIDQRNNKILTFITYIGCGISAVFSAATLLTYIAFEKLRRDYPSKILMNLSASLLLLNMVFLLDGWLSSLHVDWLCLSVAVLLHYFLLTSFTWMGLESVHMYIALVKVFNTYIRRYILKFCIMGWGLPAVLVGIVVMADKKSYGLKEYGRGESARESTEFCWIDSPVVFYTTCVGYFCLVFLLNVAMFIVVMLQICGRNGKRTNRSLREEVLRNLRSAISLTFLLGMTWGFAFFAWGPVSLAFTYLFAIFNSLQGLFIFFFHCALKENVQKQWRRYLCCGRFRLSEQLDWSKTATNNTKKVSSDNLAKSLSSSSFGSTTASWTSKAKATLNPFTKRHSNTDKCYSSQTSPKCISSSSSSSEVEPNSSSSSSSILPVSQMIDKVRGYCSTRSDNFYKNIIMSDSFANSTRF
ncbi:adhesion G-protein coupled receptor G6 [Pholidichthys leucotaenia]